MIEETVKVILKYLQKQKLMFRIALTSTFRFFSDYQKHLLIFL